MSKPAQGLSSHVLPSDMARWCVLQQPLFGQMAMRKTPTSYAQTCSPFCCHQSRRLLKVLLSDVKLASLTLCLPNVVQVSRQGQRRLFCRFIPHRRKCALENCCRSLRFAAAQDTEMSEISCMSRVCSSSARNYFLFAQCRCVFGIRIGLRVLGRLEVLR